MSSEIVTPPPGEMALFLDIDGTLIEHQDQPEGVRIDGGVRELVNAVSERLDGALALVTGRNIAMVDEMFAPLSLPAAGLYGLEHRLSAGGEASLADEPEDLAAVADALQEEFYGIEGIYFERKGAVLAIHTRAAPAIFPSVRTAAEKALAELSEDYRIVAGNVGLEFVPVDALKSAAIQRFMEIPPYAGRRPVFIGDDVSDESGFEYVNSCGGISIRVRPNGPTQAGFSVSNVASVHELLRDLLQGNSPEAAPR